MKQKPNHIPALTEQAKKVYEELKQKYSERELDIAFGGLPRLVQIIKDGGLNDLYSMLDQPSENWQTYC